MPSNRPPQKTLTPADNLVVDGHSADSSGPARTGGPATTESRARAGFQGIGTPVRAEMLITTRFGDTNQIHRRHPTRWWTAHSSHFFPGPRRRRFVSSPQKGGLFRIFRKAWAANEFNQNYRYNFSDGEITPAHGTASRGTRGLFWSDHGERLAYASTRRNGRRHRHLRPIARGPEERFGCSPR